MKRPLKNNEISVFHSEGSLSHFFKITSKGIMTNKQFCKNMKPFLTNKGCLENNDIILLDGEEMINNDKILAKRLSLT